MFMMASRVVSTNQSGNVTPARDTLLVVANADLFSECLVEALGKKFPVCEIVSLVGVGGIKETYAGAVKLVLLYHLAGAELQETLQSVREKHPEASIALVIDAIDMLESYLSQLVETRIIDGVLPLNLRLDVFMATVDLLIKGGEHFPSALLSRLTPAQMDKTLYQARSVVANRADALAARKGEFCALTTREVQILDLLCKGTQNKIIAGKLNLSENTVKVHVRNIYKKMNVRNRTEAASRFFNNEAGGDPSAGWRN
jgi:DNA-binding NarL/FixJ family response regulator